MWHFRLRLPTSISCVCVHPNAVADPVRGLPDMREKGIKPPKKTEKQNHNDRPIGYLVVKVGLDRNRGIREVHQPLTHQFSIWWLL